ncbi:levodione reductase [Colletotrichum spaethianum]|uniref:Levodione reductase n=1 Tax=Colletotrichum spaethianum TaxID=700344 RepID=A0AA37NYJ3_9PEZI|nr:levodione reductase [Colletotrichum spaethianum]GKT46297.1 levodione reductase [Colletotrichum spaethianum]
MAAAYKTVGVAFITGAGSGIGRATSYAFAASHALAVIFTDISFDAALAAASTSGTYATNPSYQARAYALDVTDDASVAKEFRRIDYLVNSAGLPALRDNPVPENSMDIFDETARVNTRGLLLVTRAAVRVMEKQERKRHTTLLGKERVLERGCVVNVLSVLAFGAVKNKVAYAASKHASLGITRATAQDLGDKHVRVNAVAPAWVNTAMFEQESEITPGIDQFITGISPAGRPAEADGVAEVVVFLCSPASSYVNGTGLTVDSGLTLTVH